MRENRKMRRLEPTAADILGRESFFGPNSLRVLENRIFELSGSRVHFSSTLHRVPSFKELEKSRQGGSKLIYLPDTMYVTAKSGVVEKNPRPAPITIERLFELFYSQTETSTIFRMFNDSAKEMSVRLVPAKPTPPNLMGRKERSEKVAEKVVEVIKKFEGGVLNLGGLISVLSTNHDKKISGGYHFITELVNNELKDLNAFAAENGSRLPSLMELFITQLILSANNSYMSEGSLWLPTSSLDEATDSRHFVTCSKEKGVGLATLRNDIPQYRRLALTIK